MAARKLDELVNLSFDEAKEILGMYSDPLNKDTFGVVVRAKCAIISATWTMGAKVMEESFRQKRFDRLPEIIALIKAEEKELASI